MNHRTGAFRGPLITRLDLAVALGVLFSILLANVAVFGQECDGLRGRVVRLHILANSDDDDDQAVKLRVRDRILADVGGVFATPHSQADAKAAALDHLDEIEAAAEAELRACGVDEPVRAEFCHMYFTTRRYGDLFLPAGDYDAVRVTIGSGEGHNWWCVMYPPMCVSTALAGETAEFQEIERLNGEPMFKPKLAVVELFERLFPKDQD